jgi:hypothetical protein
MDAAERIAERSTCASCNTYGSFRLIGTEAGTMTVRCRKCANEWRIA